MAKSKPHGNSKAPRPYTKGQREVIADYRAWHEAAELSMEEAAARLDCSASTLSLIESHKYPGRHGKYVERMARVMAREKARTLAWKRPPVVATTVLRKLYGLFEVCRDSHTMGFACTKFGLGKTIAAQEFARENPDTILVTAIKGISGGTLIEMIADEVGLTLPRGQLVQRLEALLDKLQRLGGPVVVIDECDFLGKAIHILRQVHDLAGCGVVVLGTPSFLRKLRKRPDGTEGQFLSRIVHQLYIDQIVEEDAEKILRPFELSAAAQQIAWQGCERNARRLVNIVANASMLAEGDDGGSITERHVAQAVENCKLIEV